MNCPTCGAKLQIEDEKCPFCGNPNPYATKHRQDMQHYQQEFQKTKSEVEKKTNIFTAYTVKITVIAVLIMLIIGFAFLKEEGTYYIWKYQIEQDVRENEKQYQKQLEAYEENENWIGLRCFYDEKELHATDTFREFLIVSYAAYEYQRIIEYLMSYEEDAAYYGTDYTASEIAKRIEELERYINRTSYDSSLYDMCYTQTHQKSLERIWQDTEALLITYCHLTKEEIAAMSEYSTAKKANLIAEALLR